MMPQTRPDANGVPARLALKRGFLDFKDEGSRAMQLKTDKMIARKEDGVGWMTFNNPDRRNAVSLAMWEAVSEIMADFAADDEIRVAVMTGAGEKAFVSGADISEFAENRNSAESEARYSAATAAASLRSSAARSRVTVASSKPSAWHSAGTRVGK